MKTCIVLAHLKGQLIHTFVTLEATKPLCHEHLDWLKALGYACIADFF